MNPVRKYNPMLGSYDSDEPDRNDWLIESLTGSVVNPDQQVNKPEIIFSIREVAAMQFDFRRVFTLGNFSAIIGRAKSKKTYLLSAISASIIAGRLMWDKFQGGLQTGKDSVIYFDTEQGDWDSWNVIRRIAMMGGENYKNKFHAYNLRRFTPKERCELVEFALTMHGQQAGLVVIDGIADLATAINDEDEATRVVSLLMRWTKDYHCHISTVIHQNKNDNFATGHLGSSITKKCEIIISVTKDETDPFSSIVNCDMSRGVDFKPFKLYVNKEGLPEIDNVSIEVAENDFSRIKDDLPF